MLSYRTEGPVAYAMLDRPEKLNAMTRGFWDDLRRVLAHNHQDVVSLSRLLRHLSIAGLPLSS